MEPRRFWVLQDWERFYKEQLDLCVDLTSLKQDWSELLGVLVVPHNLSLELLVQKCNALFEVVQEINSTLRLRSACRLGEDYNDYVIYYGTDHDYIDPVRNVRCMYLTLEERLLLELWHFLNTAEHYDTERIQLCLGSRYEDGSVPSVSVQNNVFYVGKPHLL
ncbi:MAG: hypothetical protein KGI50_02665 [Patescibacteria group bacterium]|nr:hypothetical protein [Patescibacteria group bacterium]MDE2438584.1 hypothetical protein [Patescibacteria group bacterium]